MFVNIRARPRGLGESRLGAHESSLSLERSLRKKKRARPVHRPGISRIDQPSTRTHGWFARAGFYTRPDGTSVPRHRKFFGDATHGGKRRALKAAVEYIGTVTRVRRKRGRIVGRAA